MPSNSLKLARVIFGALIVSALGFGADQALGSAASARRVYTCTWNDQQICDAMCGPQGGDCYYLDPYFENRECQCRY
ncbi:MAG TPA: hypothetical protein VFQ76_19395 [Longimicrobiaceae bacterium]|nr:hypothetical protein [Longimicrobiaceae bacterium]